MSKNVVDRMFDLQIRFFAEPGLPAEILIDMVFEYVQEQEVLSLTLFSKLLDCWAGLDSDHLEELFKLLRAAAMHEISSTPDAALSYFRAAQECASRRDAFRSSFQRKAA